MKPSRLVLGSAFVASLLASASIANAQQAPIAPIKIQVPVKASAPPVNTRPVAVAPAKPLPLPGSSGTGTAPSGAVPRVSVATPPILSAPSGLSASSASSSPLAGITATNAIQLDQIMRSVSALSVTAEFKEDKSMPSEALGPATLKSGADVKLNASFDASKPGAPATLDSLDLTTNGLDIDGPLGTHVPVTEVKVDSKGAITAKLGSWLPSVTIKSVEHKANGDTVLHGGSWFMPDITIQKDGTVVGPLGVHLGKADASIFATWPPTLESLEGLTQGKGAAAPAVPLNQLAGTLNWNVAAKAKNNVLSLDGKPIQGELDANLKGSGHLAKSQFSTIGNANTAQVSVHVAPQTIGDAKGDSATIKAGDVTLEGNYRLAVGLNDPTKSLVVDFSGKASYNLDATNVNLSLPNNAKVSVGEVSFKRDATFDLSDSKGAVAMKDDGTYTAQVKGPISVQNLGGMPSLTMDGTLTSTGRNQLTNAGLNVQGNLTGEETIEQAAGITQVLNGKQYYVKTTIQKGSKVDVNLTNLQTALQLKLSPNGQLRDLGSDIGPVTAQGQVTGHVNLGDTTVSTPQAQVSEKAAEGDVTLGVDTTKNDVALSGDVKLDAPASVDVNQNGIKAHASIDQGSTLGVNASLASVTSNGKTTRTIDGNLLGALGASAITASGPGLSAKINGDSKVNLDAPFEATVDPTGKVAVNTAKTTAQVPVSLALNKGTQVTYKNGTTSTQFTMDKDGSSVKVTGDFALDASGKPVLKDLSNADISLTIGPGTASVAGHQLSSAAEKTVKMTGRVVFRPNGMDVYGSFAVGVNGGDATPILSINY